MKLQHHLLSMGLSMVFHHLAHIFPPLLANEKDKIEACKQLQQRKPLIFRLQCQAEIESVNWIINPKIVVHTGKGRKRVLSCQAIIHREHRAQVVEAAFLGVIGEPKELGGKGILEAAVHRLVGHLQSVAPIQLRIDTMMACALIKESADGLAAHLELKAAVFLRVGYLHTQTATVLVIASVVVAADVVGSEANVHTIVQAAVIHAHRVEPTVELGEVVVEA